MFIAIVQIPMAKRPRDAAVEAAAKSAPTYTALGAKGLVKKYYLNGEAGGGGSISGNRRPRPAPGTRRTGRSAWRPRSAPGRP